MSRTSGGRAARRSTRLARLEPLEPRTLLSAAAAPFHGLTGQGQTVVVIDSGIDYLHAALGGGLGAGCHVVGGYDFTTGTANPLDAGPDGGHGTAVAGVIGSEDAAHPGIAPGADLVALKVVDNNGNSSSIWIDEALQWVNAHRNAFRYPITTVNISLSNDSNLETLPAGGGYESDLAQLAADGMFISVAAGNDFAAYGQPGLGYPAVSPSVVPVAAVGTAGAIASFSQRDSRVLAAPGVQILTTVPNYASSGADDNFGSCSGTSMAAPYVAGAAVLLRQAYQSVGVQNVSEKTLYDEMVATFGYDLRFGHGSRLSPPRPPASHRRGLCRRRFALDGPGKRRRRRRIVNRCRSRCKNWPANGRRRRCGCCNDSKRGGRRGRDGAADDAGLKRRRRAEERGLGHRLVRADPAVGLSSAPFAVSLDAARSGNASQTVPLDRAFDREAAGSVPLPPSAGEGRRDRRSTSAARRPAHKA